MKRLKQLRQSANYSQQHLASMLKTTQQTVARWESGKVEPSLSALRDLAVIFGTSVDDLLGRNPFQGESPSTTYHHLTLGGNRDGFWGHIGLKLDGCARSKWFPVTADTADRVGTALANIASDKDWVSFPTLANKFVATRPATIRKIWLLDDACDDPSGDWELDLPYQGLPLEIYRAFGRLHHADYAPKEWEAVAAAIPKLNDDGELESIDTESWSRFAKGLSKAFEEEASEAFLATAVAEFVDAKLYDEEVFYTNMHYTTLYLVGGEIEQFWAEGRDLALFVSGIEFEDVPTVVHIGHFGGDAETYYPATKLSAVVMPLIDVMDSIKEQQDE